MIRFRCCKGEVGVKTKSFVRGSWLLMLLLSATATAMAQDALTLGISEGTSGGLDHAQVIGKYQGLADTIGKSIKRKVQVVFVREFAQLEEGMATGRLDLVMARPSDYPARGVSKYGYKFVASARPDGNCLISCARIRRSRP